MEDCDRDGGWHNSLFFIARHTNNRCDRAFGLVKRELKQRSAITPGDIVEVVRNISTFNKVVLASKVGWRTWKSFLEKFYWVLTSFRNTRYHVFSFSKTDKCGMRVKRVSTDDGWKTVGSLKRSFPRMMFARKQLQALGTESLLRHGLRCKRSRLRMKGIGEHTLRKTFFIATTPTTWQSQRNPLEMDVCSLLILFINSYIVTLKVAGFWNFFTITLQPGDNLGNGLD